MIEFASEEERYFYWYLEELIAAGYVKSYIYQPKSFELFKPETYRHEKLLKTKLKLVTKTLFRGYTYQADFLIVWNPSSSIFFQIISHFNGRTQIDSALGSKPFVAYVSSKSGNIISVIDVKGNYSQNDAFRRFSIDQKNVWDKHKIYVQKIIPVPAITKKTGKLNPPTALFTATFMPKKYLYTPTGMIRKIRFPNKPLKEFISHG